MMKNRHFIRKVIVDNSNNRAVGTIEYFIRDNEPNYNDTIVLRVDVHHYYEKKKALIKIFRIAIKEAFESCECSTLITKGWEYAIERRDALKFLGFKEQSEPLIGHSNDQYYNYWLFYKR